MRADVHLAALKAAAKVAFSMVVLNGCSGGLLSQARESGDDADEGAADYDRAAPGSASTKAPTRSLGKKACPKEDAAAPAKASCEQTLAAAFPTPGDYQWKPVPQSKDVVACCDADLAAHEAMSKYRWDCCVAYDAAEVRPEADEFALLQKTLGAEHGMACTPWGPPVPPAMNRRRGTGRAAIQAWLAKGGQA